MPLYCAPPPQPAPNTSPHSHLVHPLPQSTAWAVVREAVALEREFVCEALRVEMLGMNAGLMSQYIEFVADR